MIDYELTVFHLQLRFLEYLQVLNCIILHTFPCNVKVISNVVGCGMLSSFVFCVTSSTRGIWGSDKDGISVPEGSFGVSNNKQDFQDTSSFHFVSDKDEAYIVQPYAPDWIIDGQTSNESRFPPGSKSESIM